MNPENTPLVSPLDEAYEEWGRGMKEQQKKKKKRKRQKKKKKRERGGARRRGKRERESVCVSERRAHACTQ